MDDSLMDEFQEYIERDNEIARFQFALANPDTPNKDEIAHKLLITMEIDQNELPERAVESTQALIAYYMPKEPSFEESTVRILKAIAKEKESGRKMVEEMLLSEWKTEEARVRAMELHHKVMAPEKKATDAALDGALIKPVAGKKKDEDFGHIL